jgi:SAM-dependent methyltransferase
VLDDGTPTPEAFDEVFARVSAAPRTNELFDHILDPFPAGVEPFSLVPRQGLDRVLAAPRLEPGDHLVDLCCGRGGIGLWFASVSGARLTGVDFSPAAIAEDTEDAEPALRLLAEAGRDLLPLSPSVRRLLLVAGT